MSSITQPAPENTRRGAREFANTRWLYQKDGRDIGPFKPPEIKDILRRGDIGPDTMVRDTARHSWHRLREVKAFVDFLKDIQAERDREAHRKDLDKAETRVHTSRKLPWILATLVALGLVGGGGWYGWRAWQAAEAFAPSGYTVSLYRNLELVSVPTRAFLDTSGPIDWADEKVAARRAAEDKAAQPAKKARPRPHGESAGAVPIDPAEPGVATSDDLAGADAAPAAPEEVSFDKAAGREFTSEDVNSILERANGPLHACAAQEANRDLAFPGTTVRFVPQASGRMGAVSIGQNGSRSRAFVSCVNSVLHRVRVEPFDGFGRALSIRLDVSR